jgi:uncharacterized membrane protein YfcA
MFGLPMEVITLLISLVGGAALKLMAQAQADKAEQQKILMSNFSASEGSRRDAREFQTANANWARRFLVVAFVGMAFFILLAPLLGYPTVVPVEVTSGFKILFFDFTNTVTEWVSLEGVVTPHWLPHAIMSVTGFYFGQSVASRK